MTLCPKCGKPGGVELLTSISPCDACLAPKVGAPARSGTCVLVRVSHWPPNALHFEYTHEGTLYHHPVAGNAMRTFVAAICGLDRADDSQPWSEIIRTMPDHADYLAGRTFELPAEWFRTACATWEPFTRPINRRSNFDLTILYTSVQAQLAGLGAGAIRDLKAKRGGW